MDVDGFERWWRTRERADIEWIIDAIEAATDTADGEVERWRATREIARVLDRSGLRRQACAASHRVRLCALAACSDTGVRDVDPDGATLVCRAAGEAALGLVAGAERPCSEMLLRPFVAAPSHA